MSQARIEEAFRKGVAFFSLFAYVPILRAILICAIPICGLFCALRVR